MNTSKDGLLSGIIANKSSEVKQLSSLKVDEFKRTIDQMPRPMDFLEAVCAPMGRFSVIAEIKKASPSMGAISSDVDAGAMSRLYEDCGAAAISVLTDGKYFSGSIDDLIDVRRSVGIPLLRKDFIIHHNQIFESRVCGADAILLIVAALDDSELRDFYQIASGLGMSVLVETHTVGEIERALALDPSIIGINNRCLNTLKVDLTTSEKLRGLIPDEVCVISESGIRNKSDAIRLQKAGVNGFLVGTSIMKSENPAQTLRELTGH